MVSDSAFQFHVCISYGKPFLFQQGQGHLPKSQSNIKFSSVSGELLFL